MSPTCNQKQAAEMFGVDERELRDYIPWSMGIGDKLEPLQQKAFDWSYEMYCSDNAKEPFAAYLGGLSLVVGLKPRAIKEIWEVNPIAYPSGYLALKF